MVLELAYIENNMWPEFMQPCTKLCSAFPEPIAPRSHLSRLQFSSCKLKFYFEYARYSIEFHLSKAGTLVFYNGAA